MKSMIDSESVTETAVPEWKPKRQILTASGDDDNGFYKSEGLIELRIERFEEFVRDEQEIWSVPVYILGWRWEIEAYSSQAYSLNNRNKQLPFKDLEVYLCCNRGCASETWLCEAKYGLRIMPQTDGVKDIILQDTDDFSNKRGHSEFANCDMLLDPKNGFIKNGTIILQAHIQPFSVNKMFGTHAIGSYGLLFSLSTQYCWDFVLIVQDKEVHVQKSYLAMHSDYFKNQFANDECDNRAILVDVDYHDFIELLNVIYPSLCPITAENVETIAGLAFKFYMAALLKRCEIFLIENISKFGRVKPLLLAEWYGLVDLQQKIIDQIENIADIKEMKPEYDALSDRTKRKLFDIMCSPGPVSNPVSEPENMAITINRATKILHELASSVHCPPSGFLIVENKRIPIHKEHLAMYSEYFAAMLQGDFVEGNMDEIVLEEVGYNEMLELLAVIYPTALAITDVNVGIILKLADRFIMAAILARCKKLLLDSTEMRTARKLWFAQRYNLPDLQAEYAKNYRTMSDVEKLRAEPEFGLFDDKTRALLLDSITS